MSKYDDDHNFEGQCPTCGQEYRRRADNLAYSDEFNHIIVKYGSQKHGYDLARAIQLRGALDQAISKAANPGDRPSKVD